MIWISMGTGAELIKLYGIIRRCEQENLPWYGINTGQSGEGLLKQWEQFGLSKTKLISLWDHSQDLENVVQAVHWFTRTVQISAGKLVRLLETKSHLTPSRRDIWIVHGDTLSSCAGAILAQKLSMRLAHIEAGLSSHSIFEPFPEELCRRFVSRKAHFLFPPDGNAEVNLRVRKLQGEITCTFGNTLYDTVQYALMNPVLDQLPEGRYIVANLHRYENMRSRERFKHCIDLLVRAAKTWKTHFILHPITAAVLQRNAEARTALQDSGVQLMARRPFLEFLPMLARAEFIVSDGGSNQEECYYLGLPCLIARNYTERIEGLGKTCVISKLNTKIENDFFENYEKYRSPRAQLSKSPSDLVIERLKNAL